MEYSYHEIKDERMKYRIGRLKLKKSVPDNRTNKPFMKKLYSTHTLTLHGFLEPIAYDSMDLEERESWETCRSSTEATFDLEIPESPNVSRK